MLLLSFLTACICFLAALAKANTEKVIFTAPDSITLGNVRPNLIDLQLVALSPKRLAVRTSLPVEFPDHHIPRGLQSWYLLHGLEPGQRYEVRICWPATQPTEFLLETYDITHVFDNTSLIQDLGLYTEERQSLAVGEDLDDFSDYNTISKSALFLRVWSAADFFTTDKKLMQNPPPVDVDIILDPYLYNIFPQSLLPTAAYIIVLAVGSWYLSGFAWVKLQAYVNHKQHVE